MTNEIMEVVDVGATQIEPNTPTTALSPQEMIQNNGELVRLLAPEIQTHHLAAIQGKEYMCVGGGIAIANSMGFTISVGKVVHDKSEGLWEAEAVLKNANTGAEVGIAMGYVGDDEKRWMTGPKAARNSMVQTRAIAKLCRSNFGHLYTLLGAASATPAEEMQMVEAAPRMAPAARPVTKKPAPKPASKPAAAPRNDSDGGEKANTQEGEGTLQVIITAVEEFRRDKNNDPPKWVIWSVHTDQNDYFSTFDGEGEYAQAELAMSSFGGRAILDWYIDPKYPNNKKIRDGGIKAAWPADMEREEGTEASAMPDDALIEDLPF